MTTEFSQLQGDELLWAYNCLDCVYTREVGEAENKALGEMGLREVDAFQQAMFFPVLHAMIRGVRIDLAERARMRDVLQEEMTERLNRLTLILGHTLNPRSGKQMQALFYEDFKQPIQWSKGTKKAARHPTLDDTALSFLAKREPLLRPLVKIIQEYRSLGVFLGTFVEAELDYDNRMRCSYNICGTETYRLSSSKNPFEKGTNLQNIPKGGSVDKGDPDALTLPNIKTIFIPDDGMEFFDCDLQRADLYTVVWEADDRELKRAMALGLDMHCFSACDIFGIRGIPPEELVETHSNYPEHRGRIGETRRQATKVGVHATNYGVQSRTLSVALGQTQHEAQGFIDRWFAAHPGIREWHRRTEEQLKRHHYVENRFGYRRYYFERTEGLLPEALAWTPQSTTGNVINRIWMHLFESAPMVQVLLQVHDSLAGQFPIVRRDEAIAAFRAAEAAVVVPYDDPLTIPLGVKTSVKNWGECK